LFWGTPSRQRTASSQEPKNLNADRTACFNPAQQNSACRCVRKEKRVILIPSAICADSVRNMLFILGNTAAVRSRHDGEDV
jgi:hypothetical protein